MRGRRLACSFLLAAVSSFAGSLTYTKSFPGSSPAYLNLQILADGNLTYTETEPGGSTEGPPPLHARLANTESESLFSLANQLDWKQQFESGLKVANTGKKTFRYEAEGGSPPVEQTFNYSNLPAVHQLLTRFEDIVASERAYIDLERSVQFDKLGINDALAQVEALWLHKQLAAPAQFLPLLTRIASHSSFMHLVRDRASKLKEEFEKAGNSSTSTNSGEAQGK